MNHNVSLSFLSIEKHVNPYLALVRKQLDFLVCNHVTIKAAMLGVKTVDFIYQRIYIKIDFSSQRKKMLLFLTTNMGAVTSHANQQYRCCAWVPHIQQNIKDIESVQRRAARFCEKWIYRFLYQKITPILMVKFDKSWTKVVVYMFSLIYICFDFY